MQFNGYDDVAIDNNSTKMENQISQPLGTVCSLISDMQPQCHLTERTAHWPITQPRQALQWRKLVQPWKRFILLAKRMTDESAF